MKPHVKMTPELNNLYMEINCLVNKQNFFQAIQVGLDADQILQKQSLQYQLNPEEVESYDFKIIGSFLYTKLAEIYIELNNPSQAIGYLIKSVAFERSSKGSDQASILRLAGAYARIGKSCFYSCNYDLSIHFLKLAKQILEQNQLESTSEMGLTLVQLGNYFRFMFQDDEALKSLDQSIQIRKDLFGEISIEVAESCHGLAQLQADTGHIDQSRGTIDYAISIYEQILGRRHIKTAKSIYLKGNLFLRLNPNTVNLACAEALILESLGINQQIVGENFIETADCYHSLGKIKSQIQDSEEYIEYFQKALRILEQVYGNIHACIAILLNNLGRAYYDRKRYQDAVQCFSRSIDIYQKICGDTHGNLAITLKSCADCHKHLGRSKEAHSQYSQSLDIYEVFRRATFYLFIQKIETDFNYTKKQIKKLILETETED